jgi:hypothetical protein
MIESCSDPRSCLELLGLGIETESGVKADWPRDRGLTASCFFGNLLLKIMKSIGFEKFKSS